MSASLLEIQEFWSTQKTASRLPVSAVRKVEDSWSLEISVGDLGVPVSV